MTQAEIEELFLDYMTDYLPKSVSKSDKKRFIREILRELQEQKVLELDGEEVLPDPDAEPAASFLDRIED